jgi:hypothetical protein
MRAGSERRPYLGVGTGSSLAQGMVSPPFGTKELRRSAHGADGGTLQAASRKCAFEAQTTLDSSLVGENHWSQESDITGTLYLYNCRINVDIAKQVYSDTAIRAERLYDGTEVRHSLLERER